MKSENQFNNLTIQQFNNQTTYKMNKKIKSFLYNFIGFSVFYIPAYLLVMNYSHLQGLWIAVTAFMISLLLAPKFQAIKTHDGEKIFVKWIFIKGIKEVK